MGRSVWYSKVLLDMQVFASHAQFKDWFSNPLTGMVEGQEAVNKVRLFPCCDCLCSRTSAPIALLDTRCT